MLWRISLSPRVATTRSIFAFSEAISLMIDSSRRLNQVVAVFRQIPTAVKVLQLRLEIGESRCEIPPEPVQDSEVGLVDAVHVAGNGGRRDLRGVVVGLAGTEGGFLTLAYC